MPLNPNIPLAAVQPRRNSLTDDYVQAMGIKQAQQQMAAQDLATQLATERRNALKGAYGPEGLDYAAAEQALVGVGDVEGAIGIRGQKLKEDAARQGAQKDRIALAIKTAEYTARVLGATSDQQSLDAAVARLNQEGIPVQPQQWSPQFLQQVQSEALDIKDRLSIGLQRDQFAETQRHNKASERTAAINAGREPLVEIYDESSPTGTSFVPRSQAVGKPGKPPSSMEITTADGTVIRQGRNAGGMSSPTRAATEKDAIKQGGLVSQLTVMEQGFKPEFFTLSGRFKNAVRGGKALIDPKLLSPEEQAQYTEFRDFKANTGRTQAQIINDLYGAALSEGEAKRADQFLVTEADDAVTAERKIKGYREFVQKALAKNAYILRNGLAVDAVDVEKMPSIMRKRGDEIAAELQRQNMQGDALKQAVKQRLSDEFGLVGY